MANWPRITVVTPSFNQGEFLEETLCSVLDQGYPDLEYLVIDGGSTDRSVKIIQKYAKYLSYWVSEPDRGQAEAINKGFARSTGDLLAWLNSDDLYCPGALAAVGAYFVEHPRVDLMYGDAEIIDDQGEFVMHRKELPFDRWMGLLIGFGVLIPQPSAFWRRRILDRVGFLNIELQYCFDSDYWARISDEYRIEHFSRRLSRVRYHARSKSMQYLHGQADQAGQELRVQAAGLYDRLTISRWIPYRYSAPIRMLYRMKRVLLRVARGHYFSGYRPLWLGRGHGQMIVPAKEK